MKRTEFNFEDYDTDELRREYCSERARRADVRDLIDALDQTDQDAVLMTAVQGQLPVATGVALITILKNYLAANTNDDDLEDYAREQHAAEYESACEARQQEEQDRRE